MRGRWRYWVSFRKGQIWLIRDTLLNRFSSDGEVWFCNSAFPPWTNMDLVGCNFVPMVKGA